MKIRACILASLICMLVAACNDERQTSSSVSSPSAPEIRTDITIAQALEARGDTEVDILFEGRLRKIPAVAERVGEIKQALASRHINNSICVPLNRGVIGKTAFVCNSYDYDVMFLAREASKSITANLRYIEEFAEDPLRSSLTRAIQLIGSDAIDEADADCVRIVFMDPNTGEVRKEMPILLMIAPTELMAQTSDTDRDLQRCLQ